MTESASALPKVALRGVCKTYPVGKDAVEALGGVDLEIADGEFVAVVGPSGCGKSTLLRMIAGIERPTAGELLLRHSDRQRALTSVAFQDYSIFPWKTVLANVTFGLRMMGVRRSEARAKAREWLKVMDLEDFAGSYPATLSGGMKQRVALARAMAVEPELLLLDEPFAALDAQRRLLLQEDLLAQWEQGDRRTAVLVTHSLDEAVLLSDRIVLISARPGTVKETWTVPFPRPRDPELRATPEFGQLVQDLWHHLKAEVLRADADELVVAA